MVKEREKKNINMKQTERLRERRVYLWVAQAKALAMGQPVMGEWLQ